MRFKITFPLGLCSLLGGNKTTCSPLSAIEPDLIYTDILGLGQIQKVVLNGWVKHKYVLSNWSVYNVGKNNTQTLYCFVVEPIP